MNEGTTIKPVYITKEWKKCQNLKSMAYEIATIVLVNSELSRYSRDTWAASEMIWLLPSLGLIQSQG